MFRQVIAVVLMCIALIVVVVAPVGANVPLCIALIMALVAPVGTYVQYRRLWRYLPQGRMLWLLHCLSWECRAGFVLSFALLLLIRPSWGALLWILFAMAFAFLLAYAFVQGRAAQYLRPSPRDL